MFVQWCVKGIRGRLDSEPPDSGLLPKDAVDLICNGHGILCNWWRRMHHISPSQVLQKLTSQNLSLHVNNYNVIRNDTPFISLAVGCVERRKFLRTNKIWSAIDTAKGFATANNTRSGYLFYCWVVVNLNPAAEVQAVSEEVRELNTYRSWSAYQLEGEVTAKIHIPANQIERCECWEPGPNGARKATLPPDFSPDFINPNFVSPSRVGNLRELF